MRRCGSVSCLVGTGLLVSTLVAGGAFAAPGGNGKSHGANGLALAKGHTKHVVAAPQLSQTETQGVTHEPAKAAPPLERTARTPRPPASQEVATAAPKRRAAHLTICHLTGSGRYIVISPSATGAQNGHLSHGDDFVYTGSCARGASSPPPASDDPPSVRPDLPESGPAPASPSEELPFTGFPVEGVLLAGFGLLLSGFALRRKPTS